jgi:protoheme IX farnesyltransferase
MRASVNTTGVVSLERSRVADYFTLTKPELTFLSVLTTLAGFYLASVGEISLVRLLHTIIGTGLVGGGAGALNQYIEREYDALMRRTENRPLPSGRLGPHEVLIFGIVISFAGLLQLTLFVNVLTGALGFVTLFTYLFLYTPLKRLSWVSTIFGGIPGALPPVMGWTAARNEVSVESLVLFALLFAWQMPHFFSLAWMYRKDYERAGYPMLTVIDKSGKRISRHILGFTIGLVVASWLLAIFGSLGITYRVGATALGVLFILPAAQLALSKSNTVARRLFFVSLLYLPALFALIVADKL